MRPPPALFKSSPARLMFLDGSTGSIVTCMEDGEQTKLVTGTRNVVYDYQDA